MSVSGSGSGPRSLQPVSSKSFFWVLTLKGVLREWSFSILLIG